MKRHFFTMLAVAAAMLCSCNDALEKRVDSLEARVTALEEKVQSNVDAIKKLVEASESAVTVNSVLETDNGYVISFSNGTTATLSNGQDGAAGETPAIGVTEIDGILYWTVNGEPLKNGEDYVPVTGVDGVTPQFKVDNGKWYVSYNGSDWDEAGDAVTEVRNRVTAEETATEYIFTIDETTVIRISKTNAFAIKVEQDDIEIKPGGTVEVKYILTGADATTHVIVDAKNLYASVDESAAVIKITVSEELRNGYVIVKAVRNSDGAYSAQYIVVTPNVYGTSGSVIVTSDENYINW